MTEQEAVNSANKPEAVHWLTLAAALEAFGASVSQTLILSSSRADRMETYYWLLAAQAIALVGFGIGFTTSQLRRRRHGQVSRS